VLAVTLFAHDPATFGVHVSAWLGVDGWLMESVAAVVAPVADK
jgi:hypothetical protein